MKSLCYYSRFRVIALKLVAETMLSKDLFTILFAR